MFGFNLQVFSKLLLLAYKKVKPIAIVWVCWNDLGKSVKIRSVQLCSKGFL